MSSPAKAGDPVNTEFAIYARVFNVCCGVLDPPLSRRMTPWGCVVPELKVNSYETSPAMMGRVVLDLANALVTFGVFIKRQRKQDNRARLHQVGRLFHDGCVLPWLNVLG